VHCRIHADGGAPSMSIMLSNDASGMPAASSRLSIVITSWSLPIRLKQGTPRRAKAAHAHAHAMYMYTRDLD
jgi:hypothetical protein